MVSNCASAVTSMRAPHSRGPEPSTMATVTSHGGEDYLEDDPTVEVVRWYDRPGWPLGGMQPSIAIAGAFVVGLALGAAVATGELSPLWATVSTTAATRSEPAAMLGP